MGEGVFSALLKMIGGMGGAGGAGSKIGIGSSEASGAAPSMGALMGSMGGGGGGKPYKDTKEDDYALSMRPLSLYQDMSTPAQGLPMLNGLTGLANNNQPRVIKQPIPNGVIQMMLQRMRGY